MGYEPQTQTGRTGHTVPESRFQHQPGFRRVRQRLKGAWLEARSSQLDFLNPVPMALNGHNM